MTITYYCFQKQIVVNSCNQLDQSKQQHSYEPPWNIEIEGNPIHLCSNPNQTLKSIALFRKLYFKLS